MNKLAIALCVFLLFNCKNQKSDQFTADDLGVSWSVVKNMGDSYEQAWEITNLGDQRLGDQGWVLYYNQIAGVPVPETLPAQVKITQISGTFYSISPAPGFQLDPEQRMQFDFQCGGNAIKISDAPTGLYMTFEAQEEPQLITNYTVTDFNDPQQINRSDIDRVPIPGAQVRYRQSEKLSVLEDLEMSPIVPTPLFVDNSSDQQYELPVDMVITYKPGLEKTAQMLADKLNIAGRNATISEDNPDASITLSINKDMLNSEVGISEEGYSLNINDQGISIVGGGPGGVFYGTQSFLSLLPLSYWETSNPVVISGWEIMDGPRFPYRGMHLDVSRNFHKPAAVKKLMDIMAFYKLNKFHFHLTDDEGWRLAIKGLPELTTVGATRGHTLDETDYLSPAYGSGPFPNDPTNHGTGFYSREEFIDILQFAHARNIEVIPEINFPGHARAAIKAMEARERRIQSEESSNEPSYLLSDPQDSSVYKSIQGYDDNVICACQESTYQFMEYVVSDIVTIYQEAEVPLNVIHTGGDEVPAGIWEKSPACAELLANDPELQDISNLPNYFLKRYHEILDQHDLVTAGWEEIAMHRVESEVGGEDDPLSSRSIMVPNPEFVDNNFLAYVWLSIWGVAGEDLAYQLANRGYKVVMSNASNLYFDFAYDKDPLETGLYWAGLVGTRQPFELAPLDIFKTGTTDIMGNPLSMDNYEDYERLTDEGRKNILGIQGQLWSETVKGHDQMEYYIFPKLLGLAERAWAKDPAWANYSKRSERLEGLEVAWNSFANGIAQYELPRLDHLWGSVNYRLPPPGSIVENGVLYANVALPGLSIHYTLDGTEPDLSSPKYINPVELPASSVVKLKSFSSTGKSSRTTSLLAE